MRRCWWCCLLLMPNLLWANTDLVTAIDGVRSACGGISDDLAHLKTMAGINTAVTSVGTVAGGVALGTVISKVKVDETAAELERELAELRQAAQNQKLNPSDAQYLRNLISKIPLRKADVASEQQIQSKEAQLAQLEQKSKTLGNVRTGTLAASTATNIAGAVIAGTNTTKHTGLAEQIDACVAAVKVLSDARMQARIAKTDSDELLDKAQRIVRACDEFSVLDISAIDKRATGATVSSGVGAGLGLVGTITSAKANSNKVRQGDVEKEKGLNTVSNVLAGGATAASVTATVFNATQIAAIKRAVSVADNCAKELQ